MDYVNGIVVNGLSQCIIASADQLLSQARTTQHLVAVVPGSPKTC